VDVAPLEFASDLGGVHGDGKHIEKAVAGEWNVPGQNRSGSRGVVVLPGLVGDADRKKWDERYRRGEHVHGQAPGWLRELDPEIPTEGRAIDVAAGTGRVAVWLGRRGLDVTAVDISPVGLALAREAAADEGVRVRTQIVDLERDPFPDGPFAVIACFNYRQRSLFPIIKERLGPGGVAVLEQPTVRNLERHAKPSRRWLVEQNELLHDLSGLTVLYYREQWTGGRHLARLVAQKDG
jgi:SAM-dependent methyltransferase